jgi:hypothetical protein
MELPKNYLANPSSTRYYPIYFVFKKELTILSKEHRKLKARLLYPLNKIFCQGLPPTDTCNDR